MKKSEENTQRYKKQVKIASVKNPPAQQLRITVQLQNNYIRHNDVISNEIRIKLLSYNIDGIML